MVPRPDVQAYLQQLPDDRIAIMKQLVDLARTRLPEGFEERMQYGMPSWVVPHALYPPGYHRTPDLPLSFLHLASQKSHIALYHMGLYASPQLMDWFVAEYPKHCKTKLNMGKSCVRFKSVQNIPYDLVGDLCSKMSPEQWIALYEAKVKRS